MIDLNTEDIRQLESKGIDKEQIESQVKYFEKGFPFMNLAEAATAGNGILVMTEQEVDEWVALFEAKKFDFSFLKFVPASGAASRMFKHLFEFVQMEQKNELIQQTDSETGFNSVGNFIRNLKNFAFYDALESVAEKSGDSLSELIQNKNYSRIIQLLLNDEGLGYASLPKALLLFHSYPDGSRFALEEHLIEAFQYASDEEGLARVHFTISPEHRKRFEAALTDATSKHSARLGARFEISLSEQKPSTDTIAVDMFNKPFRNNDGSLLFRPGGHGALIENLNDLTEDIIFVKNIDNIVPDRLRSETYRYKKALAGLLVNLQEQVFDYLDLLDSGNLELEEINEISAFASNRLMIDIPNYFEGLSEIEKIDFLFIKLNRPIRVCGMVRNEGEPGGGPFWVLSPEGERSLQVVESSQIDFNQTKQAAIVKGATHFNPVDLVCGVYDFQGNKFDLREFIDPETGFISVKSKDGRDLKALELPGLWNGAMSDWITVFVETPIITFNPVKTVNDLLRKQHQPID
jgi:hypothetical protein